MTGRSAANGCAPAADRLPELALGILGGAERADVLAHLDRCATCRDASAGWAATVDALPALLGDAEPPSGFAARTAERLRADRSRVPRRSRLARILTVAAIVAAVMIVTLATVRILDARTSDPAPTARDVTSAPMVGAHSGNRAGAVFMTSGEERYVFLDVDYGVRSGTYRIEAVYPGDRVTRLGEMAVTEGSGAWAGAAPEGVAATPTMVRLVSADGEVFCTARFGPVAS